MGLLEIFLLCDGDIENEEACGDLPLLLESPRIQAYILICTVSLLAGNCQNDGTGASSQRISML